VLVIVGLVAAGPVAQAAVAAFLFSNLFLEVLFTLLVAGAIPTVVMLTEQSAAAAAADAAARAADAAARAAYAAAQTQRDADAVAQRAADAAAQTQRDADAVAQRAADAAAQAQILSLLSASADLTQRRLGSAFAILEGVRAFAASSAPACLCSWPAARLGSWFAESKQWRQYEQVFARHDGWSVSALVSEQQLVELGVLKEHAGPLLADLRSIR